MPWRRWTANWCCYDFSKRFSLSCFFLVGFYGTQINGPLSMQQRMGQEWKTLIFFLLFPSVLIFFYFFGQKNHKSDNKKRMLMIIRALKVFSFFTFFLVKVEEEACVTFRWSSTIQHSFFICFLRLFSHFLANFNLIFLNVCGFQSSSSTTTLSVIITMRNSKLIDWVLAST